MPWWHWILIVFLVIAVFGAMICAGLLMVVEFASGHAASGQVKAVLMSVSSALSLVLLILFVRWDQDRWHWTLTADALIGGKKGSQTIPLSSIETVVPGLPEKTNVIVTANKFIHPELWQTVIEERRLALLLKLTDGSFMPLHVHKCVDGRALMSELIRRLASRIDPEYVYTPREVKALRSADWNRVVKRLG